MNNCPVSAGLLYLNMPASIACYAYVIQYVHICLEKCVGKKKEKTLICIQKQRSIISTLKGQDRVAVYQILGPIHSEYIG